MVVLFLTVALRAVTASRWTWTEDDWVFMHDAVSMDFTSYLFQAYNGHLLPGGFLLTWLITVIAPLNHGLAVLVTVLLVAAGVLAWAAAFREVFGERARLLVPLVLIALTPLAVRPTVWWTAAVLMLPLQICTGLAVLFTARYARRASIGNLAGVIATLLVGLFFWEKALLMVIPIGGTLLFCSRTGLWHTVRRAWPLVVMGIVSTASYLVVYERAIAAEDTRRAADVSLSLWPGLGTALNFYGDALTRTLAPAALGGPWGSMPVRADRLSEPRPVTMAISCVIVLVLVVAAVLYRRRSWLPFTMLAAYGFVAVSLVLFSSRLAVYGVLAIRDERYTIDTATVGALALAMLIAAPRGAPELGGWRRRPPAWLQSRRVLMTGVGALVVSLVVGNTLAAERTGTFPGREWVDNVLKGVDHDAPAALYDSGGPPSLGLPVGDDGLLSRLLSPLGSKVSFDGPAESLLTPDARGRLRPAIVTPTVRAAKGPVPGCGYALTPGQDLHVPLNTRLFDFHWGMQLTEYAGTGGILEVDIDDDAVQLQINKGFARFQVGFAGPVTDVRLHLLPGSEPVCVTDLIIGPVQAGTS